MAKKQSATGGLSASIDAGMLASAARRMAGIVERKSTIPICSTTRIEARDGKICLTATDLDREITETIDADVDAPGAVCVRAHDLSGVLNKAPARARLVLSMDGNRLKLKYGSAIAKLDSLPADDFPSFAAADPDCTWQMPAAQLVKILDGVSHAVSTDASRYYLNGVFLHILDGRLLAGVATDGHRCCRRAVPLPGGIDDLPPMIIPVGTAKTIAQICDKGVTDVTVSVSSTFISVETGSVRLSSKLIDGTFPDYQRVIPSGSGSVCIIDADVLAASLRRVATIASDKVKGLSFIFEPARLRLGIETPDVGAVVEELEASFTGTRMESGFNGNYLAEALERIDGNARIRLIDPSSPAIISNEADDGDTPADIEVVMPMRISGDIERHFDDEGPARVAA
jgi:DNA polymerase-3 subunit beta